MVRCAVLELQSYHHLNTTDAKPHQPGPDHISITGDGQVLRPHRSMIDRLSCIS